MAIPQRSPHNLPSKLERRKPLDVKVKLPKKKLPVLACHKAKKLIADRRAHFLAFWTRIEQEDIDNVKNPTTRAPMGYGNADTSVSALDRATELQTKLPSQFPSCLKLMLRSHVTGGFWLSLPKQFSYLHLPNHDAAVTLVDENNEEYDTKYLIGKNGLSGGWRGFSIAHGLLEGDVVVFQLIKPCRIKVYIMRANNFSEIDGALSLLNLDFQAKPTYNAVNTIVKWENQNAEDGKNFSIAAQKFIEPYTKSSHQEAVGHSDGVAQSGNEGELMPIQDHQSRDETGEFGSEIMDGIRFSESVIDFKDVKDFESFHILVDGLVIDSEIPKHLQTKYYELCCSQNSFLHDHLIKGLNCKLAAGVISETVNIADAIRASKLNTLRDYLQIWDRTLKAFEDIGMAVGFLRHRIKKLVCLQCEEPEIIKSKRLERAQVEMDKKNLEDKLSRAEEIETLRVKNEKLALTFEEMATAPW